MYPTKDMSIKIDDIQLNNTMAIVGVAVWSNKKRELLFRCRISVVFEGVPLSTGNNFLKVSYSTREDAGNR